MKLITVIILLTLLLFIQIHSIYSIGQPSISITTSPTGPYPLADTVVNIEFTLNLHGSQPSILLNYVPRELAFNLVPTLPCVDSNGTVIFLWDNGPYDTPFSEADGDIIATRSYLIFPDVDQASGLIQTLNDTKCSVQIELKLDDYVATTQIGSPYWGVPIQKKYGYSLFSMTRTSLIESGVLDFPYLRAPFELLPQNDCFDEEYCFFDLNFDVDFFFANKTHIFYTGHSDIFNGGEFTCFRPQGVPVLSIRPTEYGMAVAGTVDAYDMFASGVFPEKRLSVTCILKTSAMSQVSGKASDVLIDITTQQTSLPLTYLQPIITQKDLLFAHTHACFVGKVCEYTISISDVLLPASPLIKIQLNKNSAGIFHLKQNDVCIINQFATDIVYLQVIRRTRVDPNKTNTCTLLFTPTTPTVYQKNLTPELIKDIHRDLVVTIELYQPASHIIDIDTFLSQFSITPTPFVLSNYIPYTYHNTLHNTTTQVSSYNIPFNPIMPQDQSFIAMSPVGDRCTGAMYCEITYHFFSPVPLAQIRAENYLRITNSSARYECRDAVNIIGYVTVSPSLNYMFITPISQKGLTFGYCSFVIDMKYDRPPLVAPHQYLLGRYDAYPNHPSLIAPFDYDSSVITDLVHIVYLSPHRSAVYAWYVQPNSHGNYITFRIIVANPQAQPAVTVSAEFTFSMDGVNVFDFSNVNCFAPNSRGYDVGPSCDGYQSAPNKLNMKYTRKATTLNTEWVTLSFSTGSIAPSHIYSLYFHLSTQDPIDGKTIARSHLASVDLPFPLLNDIGPMMSAPTQDNNTILALPRDIEQQTVHLFTNHITPIKFSLQNAVIIGSTLVFQLFSISSNTLSRTPLMWEIDNLDELSTLHGMELQPATEICPWCVSFTVKGTGTPWVYPELQQDPVLKSFMFYAMWPGSRFDDVTINIRYLDTFSSWGTYDKVQMLFKVQTPVALHGWVNIMKVDVPHYVLPTYDNQISANFVTYGYSIRSSLFFGEGFLINAALAGTDAAISSRQKVTLTIQGSTFLTESTLPLQYLPTIKTVSWEYAFIGCTGWEFATPLDICRTDATTAGRLDVKCSGERGIQTSFMFYAPLQTTPRQTCEFETTAVVTYTTDITNRYSFTSPLHFIPAVAAKTIAFNRNALICNSVYHPIFFVGGPGVYRITPPTEEYTVATNNTAQLSITMHGDSFLVTVLKSTKMRTISGEKTTMAATQVLPIYAKMKCSDRKSVV